MKKICTYTVILTACWLLFAGAMLRQSLPALNRWGSAILSVGLVALLTLTGLWKQALDALPAGLEYGFLLGGICLSAAAIHLQPGGRTCE